MPYSPSLAVKVCAMVDVVPVSDEPTSKYYECKSFIALAKVDYLIKFRTHGLNHLSGVHLIELLF